MYAEGVPRAVYGLVWAGRLGEAAVLSFPCHGHHATWLGWLALISLVGHCRPALGWTMARGAELAHTCARRRAPAPSRRIGSMCLERSKDDRWSMESVNRAGRDRKLRFRCAFCLWMSSGAQRTGGPGTLNRFAIPPALSLSLSVSGAVVLVRTTSVTRPGWMSSSRRRAGGTQVRRLASVLSVRVRWNMCLCIPFPRLQTLLPLPFFLSRGDFAILKELAEAELSYRGPGRGANSIDDDRSQKGH